MLEGLDNDAAASLRSDLMGLGELPQVREGVAASFEYLEVVVQTSP